ncbi:MAG: hypothetical protein ACI9U2_002732 [Bradymonadia bacterium]|jgi:hypothetical protein
MVARIVGDRRAVGDQHRHLTLRAEIGQVVGALNMARRERQRAADCSTATTSIWVRLGNSRCIK